MAGRGTHLTLEVELKGPPTAPSCALGGERAERGTYRAKETFMVLSPTLGGYPGVYRTKPYIDCGGQMV